MYTDKSKKHIRLLPKKPKQFVQPKCIRCGENTLKGKYCIECKVELYQTKKYWSKD